MIKTTSISTVVTAIVIAASQAVTLTIGGGSFVTFNGSDGTTIPDGSIVQVGYFQGVSTLVSPATFGETEWNSFTAILGRDSLNDDSRNIVTGDLLGSGTFETSAMVDTDVDTLPVLPIRLGVRIFDSTDSTNSFFNTLSSTLDDWILELPTGTPVTLGTGRADLNIDTADQADLFFQDNTNRFTTSIQSVPEPSSSVTALLGAVLLLGARRRK